ncbi:TonB C-terminal domain-containing protein [Polyangium mundeleinium]|uniref:TonB C-terminal domain-containing protein n=1 Tax=Polyangium mundeleinium TaxID=2995306 RepID=A0ABT5F5M5_9BACT|nr:TonB C-terminal domain-containing protein [Polyangium mundeleinium]MDC0748904.1 TonB C-terminal domain-containing protein [Polyangium mundeleinium]
MSTDAAPSTKSDFRVHEIAFAVICAVGLQGGALLLLRAADLDRPALAPEIDKGPSVPVKVVPVLDLDAAPALKLGGKRDPAKLPDRWLKPRAKRRVEEKAFVSTKAEKTEEAIPPKEIEVAEAKTPVPPPEAEVAKVVETPIEEPAKAEPPPNVDEKGHEDGVKGGTEMDPLKARAVDIYREKIRGWFSRRFRVSGSGLSPEEITKFRVAATVTLSGGRSVGSFAIVSSGQAAFDAAARAALESAKGEELPPPPENYPDIVQSQISLTFTCTPERCD